MPDMMKVKKGIEQADKWPEDLHNEVLLILWSIPAFACDFFQSF